MKKIVYKILIIVFFYIHSVIADTIDITGVNTNPIPIAINSFYIHSRVNTNIINSILEVIQNDLQNCKIFRSISKSFFIEKKTGITHEPVFASWKKINSHLLLNGEVQSFNAQTLRIKFVLWDTVLEKKLIFGNIDFPKKMWRKTAHKIANEIYKKVSGYEGYFDTRIVYVSERGPYTKRIKRIAIMDQDGANHQYLTDGKNIVLTPRFSPDCQKILYLSYKNGIPQVFMLDLQTKKSCLLGKFPGMSFAPRFSPDGKKALISIAQNGKTHIYEIDLFSREKTQLTYGNNIFTSPSYSPDGGQIVFQSGIEGLRHLCIMDRKNLNIKKITSSGSYSEPVLSSGNLIAFTKVNKVLGFMIGVMKYDPALMYNSSERFITSGYLVENPCWSPNGQVILFTKAKKPNTHKKDTFNEIYAIDFAGHNERLISTPYGASDPDWSLK